MRMSDWSSDVCSSDLEGERYKFGDVTVESDIRDLKAETLQERVRVEKGDWYDAQKIENIVDAMAEAAGLQGYAFADVRSEFIRDKDELTMTITYKVARSDGHRVGKEGRRTCKSR